MFKEIFDLQNQLNRRIIELDLLKLEEEAKIKWMKDFAIAFDQELKELIETLDLSIIFYGRRVHGTSSQNLNYAKIEIIDMLHFLVSMFLLAGESEINKNEIGKERIPEFDDIDIDRMLIYLSCRMSVLLYRFLIIFSGNGGLSNIPAGLPSSFIFTECLTCGMRWQKL